MRGNFLTGQADRRTVLPARAATFIGQKRTEDMAEDMAKDKAGVAVQFKKKSRGAEEHRKIKRERRKS